MSIYDNGVPILKVHEPGKTQEGKNYVHDDIEELYAILEALQNRQRSLEFLLEHTVVLVSHPQAGELITYGKAIERKKQLEKDLLDNQISQAEIWRQIEALKGGGDE